MIRSTDHNNTGKITSVMSLSFCKWAYLDTTTVTEKHPGLVTPSHFGFFLTSAWLFFLTHISLLLFLSLRSLPDVSLSSHSAWYIWDALDPWVRRKESSWNRSKPRRSADLVGEYWTQNPSQGLRFETISTEERQQGRNDRYHWKLLGIFIQFKLRLEVFDVFRIYKQTWRMGSGPKRPWTPPFWFTLMHQT